MNYAEFAGCMVVIEGIDQAGKQTVADWLTDQIRAADVLTWQSGFPDYKTPLGQIIDDFLHQRQQFPLEVRHLLYAANRREQAPMIEKILEVGNAVVLDRYYASGVAYGAAQGLDMGWMLAVEDGLPMPVLTILLDISPEVSVRRKAEGRDFYEADLGLLTEVREAYLTLALDPMWVTVDADADKEEVQQRVAAAIEQYVTVHRLR